MTISAVALRRFDLGRTSLLAATALATIVSAAAATGSESPKVSCASLTGLPIPKCRS